ncbi:hypothetical protein GCM10011571_32810 [Marinithermofilum abyssi]|uniref:Uncharacterized protein n=1 Tax=Marinithermofilum abyssi TaxID=1571185 RepID=A0A8J2YF24_9BACL|nr:hypothetical protein GCM10011571_32810 [Marinithermofilum abyssi]
MEVKEQWENKLYKEEWTENFRQGVDEYGLDNISPCEDCGTHGVVPDGEHTLRCLNCGQKGYLLKKPVTAT